MNETQFSKQKKICLKCGRILHSFSKKCKTCNNENIINISQYTKLIYLYKYSNDDEKKELLQLPEYQDISKTNKFQQDIKINGANQENKFTITQKTICYIAIIALILIALCGLPNSENSGGYQSTVRCSYCGKVIRSNGTNIHGTPMYNGGVLECDYCGHSTSIK